MRPCSCAMRSGTTHPTRARVAPQFTNSPATPSARKMCRRHAAASVRLPPPIPTPECRSGDPADLGCRRPSEEEEEEDDVSAMRRDTSCTGATAALAPAADTNAAGSCVGSPKTPSPGLLEAAPYRLSCEAVRSPRRSACKPGAGTAPPPAAPCTRRRRASSPLSRGSMSTCADTPANSPAANCARTLRLGGSARLGLMAKYSAG